MFTIIETLQFQDLVGLYLDEDTFAEFKIHLAKHPEAGDVIPLSGGVRKMKDAYKNPQTPD